MKSKPFLLTTVTVLMLSFCLPLTVSADVVRSEVPSVIKSYPQVELKLKNSRCLLPKLNNDGFDKEAESSALELMELYGECDIECDLFFWNGRIASLLYKTECNEGKRFHSLVYDLEENKKLTLSQVLRKGVGAKDLYSMTENFLRDHPVFSGDEYSLSEDDVLPETTDFILTDHCLSLCVHPKGSDGFMCVLPFEKTDAAADSIARKKGTLPWEKVIAFTFDDGPSEHTEKILDVLSKVSGKATFFVLGCHVEGNEPILSRISNEGSEIALHGYSHKDMRKLSQAEAESEISRTAKLVFDACGAEPILMRAPYGEFTSATAKSGLHSIKWSVDTRDWILQDSDRIASEIIKEAKSGDIVLLHDIFPESAEGFEKAAKHLTEEGYRLVTVTELLGLSGEKPDGRIYHKKTE